MDIEIKIKKKSVVLPCEMSQDAELGIHISSLFWQKSEDFVTSEKKTLFIHESRLILETMKQRNFPI